MEFAIENVTIDTLELRKVINSLDDAIERNQRLRELCEEILEVQANGSSSSSRGGSKGTRSRGSNSRRNGSTARNGSGALGRGRRPRGSKTLATVIQEVLQRYKKPLRPGELRDKVLAAGYQTTAKPESFYVAVFNTAKKVPGVVKTKEGFRLAR